MEVSGAFATAAMDRSSGQGKPGTLGLRCGTRGESLSTGDLVMGTFGRSSKGTTGKYSHNHL